MTAIITSCRRVVVVVVGGNTHSCRVRSQLEGLRGWRRGFWLELDFDGGLSKTSSPPLPSAASPPRVVQRATRTRGASSRRAHPSAWARSTLPSRKYK